MLSTIFTVSLFSLSPPSLVYTSLSESLSSLSWPLVFSSVLVIGNVMDFLPLDVPLRPLKFVCSVTSLSIFALRVDTVVTSFSVVLDTVVVVDAVVVVLAVVVVVLLVVVVVVVVSAGAVTGILRGGGVRSMLKS